MTTARSADEIRNKGLRAAALAILSTEDVELLQRDGGSGNGQHINLRYRELPILYVEVGLNRDVIYGDVRLAGSAVEFVPFFIDGTREPLSNHLDHPLLRADERRNWHWSDGESPELTQQRLRAIGDRLRVRLVHDFPAQWLSARTDWLRLLARVRAAPELAVRLNPHAFDWPLAARDVFRQTTAWWFIRATLGLAPLLRSACELPSDDVSEIESVATLVRAVAKGS